MVEVQALICPIACPEVRLGEDVRNMLPLVFGSSGVRSRKNLKDFVRLLQIKHLLLPSRVHVLRFAVVVAELPIRLEDELIWPQWLRHVGPVLVILSHIRDTCLE